MLWSQPPMACIVPGELGTCRAEGDQVERYSGRPVLMPRDGAPGAAVAGVRHQALLPRDSGDCLASVLDFVEEGLDAGDAVSVGLAAPLGRRLGRALGSHPDVAYFDMTDLGRNPGRIIPAMLDFAAAHDGRALRYVSQPLWPGRAAAERAEAARHESLVEPALAGVSAAIVLCVYDAGLDGADLACAEQTHRVLIAGGQERPSDRYAGPAVLPAGCDEPLAPPPAGAAELRYRDDLRAVRELVAGCAGQAGLSAGRAADLVLAVSEVAANTLRHTRGSGTLRVWRTDSELICQVTDTGHIASPLAGRRRPMAASFGQGGLWVVHQVCDLVELRTGEQGTTIRMHVRT
jgi:anti-sigma regulatory factor (Ser/Thr protein kinase)